MSIDIFGSCVTRDSFSIVKNPYKINNYFARSSLMSLYSQQLNIKMEGIELKSSFQQRILFYDLTKYFLSYIKETSADYLIIDLIDERLGVLKHQDTYLTNSFELNQSNVLRLLHTSLVNINEEYMEKWEINALRFIHDLKKCRYKKVILHKSYFVDEYLSKDGEIKYFDDNVKGNNFIMNERLKRMNNFLERNFENIVSIEPVGHYANEKHQWGLTPYHYEDKYYEDFIEKLNQIIE